MDVSLMVENKRMIDSLLVSREEIIEGIAGEFQGFLRIDKTDLSPILPMKLSNLSTRNRVLVELGIAYICYAGKLTEHPCLSREDLLCRCNVAASGLRGRISELRNEGLIVTSEFGDELAVDGMFELRKLLTTLKEKHSKSQ